MTGSQQDPVLPETTSDEAASGWGDALARRAEAGESDPEDLERFLRDVPPHHGD